MIKWVYCRRIDVEKRKVMGIYRQGVHIIKSN
jgi:Txe/YoeB family toxin of Txe-Axe toxin-antitoxin module